MSRNTVSRVIEVMKSLRVTPLDRDSITAGFGWSKTIVWSDIDELVALGVLERCEMPSRVPGKRHLVGFILSKAWGGVGAAGIKQQQQAERQTA